MNIRWTYQQNNTSIKCVTIVGSICVSKVLFLICSNVYKLMGNKETDNNTTESEALTFFYDFDALNEFGVESSVRCVRD